MKTELIELTLQRPQTPSGSGVWTVTGCWGPSGMSEVHPGKGYIWRQPTIHTVNHQICNDQFIFSFLPFLNIFLDHGRKEAEIKKNNPSFKNCQILLEMYINCKVVWQTTSSICKTPKSLHSNHRR